MQKVVLDLEALRRTLPAGLHPDPRVAVRPGRQVPANTVVCLYSGHMFAGPALRGDFYVAMPPTPTRWGPLHFGVDAAAVVARFPAPTLA